MIYLNALGAYWNEYGKLSSSHISFEQGFQSSKGIGLLVDMNNGCRLEICLKTTSLKIRIQVELKYYINPRSYLAKTYQKHKLTGVVVLASYFFFQYDW